MVAAISGQVSLVAVVANLAVAPAVGPATVLGLAGGLVGLAWPRAGRLLGTLAGWCVAWIVEVARRGAELPTAAVGWGTDVGALALLTVLAAGVALLAPRVLRPPDRWHRVLVPAGRGGRWCGRRHQAGRPTAGCWWPATSARGTPSCSGPDPVRPWSSTPAPTRPWSTAVSTGSVSTRVPLLVLTHFHADHVDGMGGVLDGRSVGELDVSPLADPADGVRLVEAGARSVGLAPTVAPYATGRRVGDVTLQVLWPLSGTPTSGPGDGSTANDASVVLLVDVRGVRMLLTGDVEPEAQQALARVWPDLGVDVLKVPHHGSRYQDPASSPPWVRGWRS